MLPDLIAKVNLSCAAKDCQDKLLTKKYGKNTIPQILSNLPDRWKRLCCSGLYRRNYSHSGADNEIFLEAKKNKSLWIIYSIFGRPKRMCDTGKL